MSKKRIVSTFVIVAAFSLALPKDADAKKPRSSVITTLLDKSDPPPKYWLEVRPWPRPTPLRVRDFLWFFFLRRFEPTPHIY